MFHAANEDFLIILAKGGYPAMSYPPEGGTPPRIRFEAIGGAWSLYQQQMGMWVLVSLIVVLIGVVINGAIARIVGGVPEELSLVSLLFAPSWLLANIIQSIVTHTLTGAAFNVAIKHVRGQGVRVDYLTEVVSIGDKLLLVSVIVGAATGVAEMFCILPTFVVGGLLMFAIPLVVDKKAEPLDAVRQSFDMLKSQWLMATLFYFVAAIIGFAGIILCGVGAILTLPMFWLSIALLYDDFVREAVEP
jgi:hypothetical protein